MPLTRTLVAGPTDRAGLPRRLDVLGACLSGGRLPWTFETLADGSPADTATPVWRLGPGFGVTEGGVVTVGLALALSATPGVEEAGVAVRRRLRPVGTTELLVLPDHVQAARPLTRIPLAVLLTGIGDAGALVAELRGTTRWTLTPASPA